MILNKLVMAAVLAASVSIGTAGLIPVSGTSNFNSQPAGILGNWTHTYSVGDAQVFVTSIEITLNSNLFFDTSPAAPGFIIDQDVATTNAGGTGFIGFSASGGTLDGGTLVALSFADFNPGETYTHVGDVDENQTLLSCGGLSGGALAVCLVTNIARVADGSLVSGSEFSGSSVKVALGGPNVANPVVLSASFINDGGNSATATWTGTVEVVPEPSTYALMGAGLLGLSGYARRRRA